MKKKAALVADLVQEFVVKAHGDLERTRELLDAEPALVNAAWDWGGGDWETGLGGAAHMGRRDIASFLLERGARMDLFAAAMLGELAVVKAALSAFPNARDVAGPHGISLLAHAQAGGEQAQGVVEFLSK